MKANTNKEQQLDHSYLLSILEYSPVTGHFYWKEDKGPNAMSGYIAGGIGSDGYFRVKINGYTYLHHRLAWFYVYKEWPKYTIDHKDKNRGNNAIDNLRDVNHSTNNHNAIKRKDNTSGIKGVSYNSQNRNWRAFICVDKKQICLGSYPFKELAIAARKKAEERYNDPIS